MLPRVQSASRFGARQYRDAWLTSDCQKRPGKPRGFAVADRKGKKDRCCSVFGGGARKKGRAAWEKKTGGKMKTTLKPIQKVIQMKKKEVLIIGTKDPGEKRTSGRPISEAWKDKKRGTEGGTHRLHRGRGGKKWSGEELKKGSHLYGRRKIRTKWQDNQGRTSTQKRRLDQAGWRRRWRWRRKKEARPARGEQMSMILRQAGVERKKIVRFKISTMRQPMKGKVNTFLSSGWGRVTMRGVHVKTLGCQRKKRTDVLLAADGERRFIVWGG